MGGWDLFPFDDAFYPARRPRGFRKLEYYSRFFDLVEINSTFYNTAIPPAQVRRWLRDVETNPDFIFTVKLFKGFTHQRRFTDRDVASTRALLETIAAGGRLGGLLVQFPSSFTNTSENRKHLLRLGSLFPGPARFIELRHNSWNDEAIGAMLRENALLPVNVDLPAINAHMPLTRHSSPGAAYLRLMGRNAEHWNRAWRLEEDGAHIVSDRYLYRYDMPQLETFAGLIRSLTPEPRTTFVVFHNDPNANSLVNGFQLRRLVNPRETLAAPLRLLAAHPDLEKIGILPERDPSGSLFDP